jgi:hypothetical protein
MHHTAAHCPTSARSTARCVARPHVQPPRLRARLAVLAALVCAAGAARAHDTWFAPLTPTPRGEAVFALGTGNQFPQQEFPIPQTQLHSSGCSAGGQPAAPMRWVADAPAAMVLRSALPVRPTAPLTCWAQLKPLEIEIDDALVEVYLKEINALPAVRERWAAQRAAGVRWKETYTKHARVELHAMAVASASSTPPGPVDAATGLGMDIRIDSPQPLRAGHVLRAQLLRDGQPLPGLPVELRSDLSPLGAWRVSDAEGRVQWTVPLAARWLLRAVDLRPDPAKADQWDSRFVTLAFEVLPRR